MGGINIVMLIDKWFCAHQGIKASSCPRDGKGKRVEFTVAGSQAANVSLLNSRVLLLCLFRLWNIVS